MPAGPVFLSPAWRDLFRHAVSEAERVGLELSLNIQSGWNLGGPIVTPERAAKLVTWSQTVISGPREVEMVLPEPSRRHGFYRDIAVVAYRDPGRGLAWEIAASSAHAEHPAEQAVDGDPASFWVSGGLKPGEGPSSQRPEWLQVTFPDPLSVAGARIVGRPGYGPRRGEVQVADAEGRFRKVGSLSVEDGTRPSRGSTRSGAPPFDSCSTRPTIADRSPRRGTCRWRRSACWARTAANSWPAIGRSAGWNISSPGTSWAARRRTAASCSTTCPLCPARRTAVARMSST